MNLGDIFRFVAPRVRDAAVKTAAQLDHLGIRYALAGGLAVGAHGYVRATVDIIELVKAGADVKRVRHYLDQYARDLIPLFDELTNEALAE